MVPEYRVLVLSDFDRASAELGMYCQLLFDLRAVLKRPFLAPSLHAPVFLMVYITPIL